MSDCRFKDLCIDAVRPSLVAAYWGALLEQPVELQAGGDAVLRPAPGMPKERTTWINGVPEAKAAKGRVHLDVRVGAAPSPWEVKQDPDGVEWCAFPPREGQPQGAFELVVDAVDPLAIAQWWAERTGATVHQDGNPWVWLEGVAGFPWDYWVFNPVPEPKTVKNRVHWDVTGDAELLVRAGATVLAELPSWTVLADPEGNELCCFSP